MPKRKDGMTRADIKARYSLDRELATAIRDVRRGTRWRSIQGSLYQASAGWFVSLTPSVHMKPGVSTVKIEAKPMSIDPIFWKIVFPECAENPLSYRFNGAWTCRPPEFSSREVSEDGGPNAMAARILDIANRELEVIEETMTVEEFLQHCSERNGDRGSYQTCVICALIALHQHSKALEVARLGQLRGQGGGFVKAGRSFNELAVEWLTAGTTTRH